MILFYIRWKSLTKLWRAIGGCLGINRRWRT